MAELVVGLHVCDWCNYWTHLVSLMIHLDSGPLSVCFLSISTSQVQNNWLVGAYYGLRKLPQVIGEGVSPVVDICEIE